MMKSVSWSCCSVALLCGVLLGACQERIDPLGSVPADGGDAVGFSLGQDTDPCQGVTCSEHGQCQVQGGVASCECEPWYVAQGLECVLEEGCGNGLVEAGEFCDPAAESAVRPCSEINPMYISGMAVCTERCTRDLSECVVGSECGNGTVELGEHCDDGNLLNGDGCSKSCADESPGNEFGALCGIPFVLSGSYAMEGEDCYESEPLPQAWPQDSPGLRVRFHVAVSEEGELAAASGDLQYIVAEANTRLSLAEITLSWDGDARLISDSDFFEVVGTESVGALMGVEPDEQALDVYVVHTIRIGENGLCGIAGNLGPWEPGGFRAGAVVLGNSSQSCAGSLAHEVGHVLGLMHTHEVYFDDEDNAGCELNGDYCCDTPFDPGTEGCTYDPLPEDICAVDCGDAEPMVSNVMSYHACGYHYQEPDNLTPCQAARAHCEAERQFGYALGVYGDGDCGDIACEDGWVTSCFADCCVPSCEDKTCGDDGCGGSCGECEPGEVCPAEGGHCECELRCLSGALLLAPDCDTVNCEALGLVCGVDPFAGIPSCIPPCEPDCVGKPCGDDGCGGSCGECPYGGTCSPSGVCSCTPACLVGNTLLLTNCLLETCGTFGLVCDPQGDDGEPGCVQPCQPDCGAKACGDDGCGGSCGECPNGGTCSPSGSCSCAPECLDASSLLLANCVVENCGTFGLTCDPQAEGGGPACVSQCGPDCAGKVCGDDGCGGSCGECPNGGTCSPSGSCSCTPECLDASSVLSANCVVENCGTFGLICDPQGGDGEPACSSECAGSCTGKACGDDGCGGSCGECPNGGTCSPSGSCSCTPECLGASSILLSDCSVETCGTFGLICDPQGEGSGPACVPPCAGSCTGKVCGDDGCGGSCGECPYGGTCSSAGSCSCTPACVGGATILLSNCSVETCGTFGLVCDPQGLDGEPGCVQPCTPNCTGKICGDDGCGGECDACPYEGTCSADGKSCTCTPECLSANTILLKPCTPQSCGMFGLVCKENATQDGEEPACVP